MTFPIGIFAQIGAELHSLKDMTALRAVSPASRFHSNEHHPNIDTNVLDHIARTANGNDGETYMVARHPRPLRQHLNIFLIEQRMHESDYSFCDTKTPPRKHLQISRNKRKMRLSDGYSPNIHKARRVRRSVWHAMFPIRPSATF